MTHLQALVVANIRARRTGVRQRVFLCVCNGTKAMATPHFSVRPVDRVTEGALS